MTTSYRVLRGLNYPPGRRAEPGDVVDDLPKGSIRQLIARGHIEPVKGPAEPATQEGGD
ncbi:hypothetical protein [Microcystis phage Mae-JY09]